MRTIIAGSRSATKQDVWEGISLCPWINTITLVLSGTAKGADKYGEEWAKAQTPSIPIELYPAKWSVYGRRAGMVRNEQMARHAQALIAVWDGSSPGTAHMIQIARIQKLQMFVYKFNIKPPIYELDTGVVHEIIIDELLKGKKENGR